MKRLGLVTVLYHSEEVLDDFFLSISIQTHDNFIIYLVDNAPSLLTRQLIKKWQQKLIPCVTHIENETNLGAAEANNTGIKKAIEEGCEDVIMLNNDITIDNPHLFESLEVLSVKNNLPIIAPKIYYAASDNLWYAGGKLAKWQAGVKHFGDRQKDSEKYTHSGFTGYSPTTFVYINAKIFDTIGLLDSNYFIYVEDVDLMYRAKLAGYKIWYEASLHLFHKVSITTGGILSDIGFYYNTRNRVYFARKFFPFFLEHLAIAYIFISLMYHAIKQQNPSAYKAFKTGFMDGLKMKISKHFTH